MREIVMDTETTGFEPSEGHRIVEIGAVELINHMPTGQIYHQYINPERDMPTEAFNVHGLSEERLSREPVFAAIAQDFVDFIGDAKLVIHNASFDMKFLNWELRLAGHETLPMDRALDTLAMARKRFPGSPATLDALCRRFGVDNSVREKHGALLDSELLAEVYLELIGGRQPDLGVSLSPAKSGKNAASGGGDWRPSARPKTLAPRLSETERALHEKFIETLGPEAIWITKPGS